MEIQLNEKEFEKLEIAGREEAQVLTIYQLLKEKKKDLLEVVCSHHNIPVPKKYNLNNGKLIIEG